MQQAIESGQRLDKIVKSLLLDIESLQKNETLTIVSAEFEPDIYDNSVVKSLTEAYERGVKIRAVAGPIVLADKNGNNGILNLFEEKMLKMYNEITRPLMNHRTLDDRGFSAIKYYPILTPKEQIKILYNFNLDDEKFWAEKMNEDFDLRIKSKIIVPVKNKNQFIVLQKSDAEGLIKKISCEKNIRYQEARCSIKGMQKNEIMKYL